MPQTFDQDAFLAGVEPPVFIAGGQTYRGIVLSADEWFRLARRLEQASPDRFEQLATIRDACDTLFPPHPRPRRWRLFRGPRIPSVADHVAQLPYGGQLEVLKGFLNAQAALQDGTLPRATTSATSGISSQS